MAFKQTAAQAARRELMRGALNDEFDLEDAKRPSVDNTGPGVSTLDWCAQQPKRLWGHTAKGRLLYFPRTEQIMVPFQMSGSGSWDCVVVRGNRVYPRGGYHLNVCNEEVECAIPLDTADAVELLPELKRPSGK